MTRILVSAFHTLLAAAYATAGLMLFAQAQVNVQWEQGFYGETTMVTTGFLFASLIMIVLAAFQGLASFGYALGWRWAAWGLLSYAFLMSMVLPSPIRWALAATAVAIVVDLWVRLPGTDEPDDGDPDLE